MPIQTNHWQGDGITSLRCETYGFVEEAITPDSQQGPISEEERAETVERQPTKSNY